MRRALLCCDGCGIRGRGVRLRRVPVEPLRPDAPDVGELALCELGCLSRPDRTWRRRWRPLSLFYAASGSSTSGQ